jgi:hypothetical protein
MLGRQRHVSNRRARRALSATRPSRQLMSRRTPPRERVIEQGRFDNLDPRRASAPAEFVVIRIDGAESLRRACSRMNDSRVKAVRQLAFDFEDEYAGRFERNIVDSDAAVGETSPHERKESFFGLWKARASGKDDVRVNMALGIISVRSAHPHIFLANKTAGWAGSEAPASGMSPGNPNTGNQLRRDHASAFQTFDTGPHPVRTLFH